MHHNDATEHDSQVRAGSHPPAKVDPWDGGGEIVSRIKLPAHHQSCFLQASGVQSKFQVMAPLFFNKKKALHIGNCMQNNVFQSLLMPDSGWGSGYYKQHAMVLDKS